MANTRTEVLGESLTLPNLWLGSKDESKGRTPGPDSGVFSAADIQRAVDGIHGPSEELHVETFALAAHNRAARLARKLRLNPPASGCSNCPGWRSPARAFVRLQSTRV